MDRDVVAFIRPFRQLGEVPRYSAPQERTSVPEGTVPDRTAGDCLAASGSACDEFLMGSQ